MANNDGKAGDIVIAPTHINDESRKSSTDAGSLFDNSETKKKSSVQSFAKFLYNPRKKTVLGRDSLNWAKLATFYTIFYFFLGCFFVVLVYIFATILNRTEPRYFNTESTMAVRSPYAVVGMGFRPQPLTDSSLIRISNDPLQQKNIVSSLQLFRDVFLLQKANANTDECTEDQPASELPFGTACSFNWFHIVNTENHPCSDSNMYGFKNERPCILVKLNKVYGWSPLLGHVPPFIQQLQGGHHNKSVLNSDVYITCAGTNVADMDVLTDTKYYSLGDRSGSSKYGVIPNYYFPYRNAKDHVQPFVLVQFNKLPLNRLVSVTCRAWAPGIEHNTKGMRGMVSFQLYRSHSDLRPDDHNEDIN